MHLYDAGHPARRAVWIHQRLRRGQRLYDRRTLAQLQWLGLLLAVVPSRARRRSVCGNTRYLVRAVFRTRHGPGGLRRYRSVHPPMNASPKLLAFVLPVLACGHPLASVESGGSESGTDDSTTSGSSSTEATTAISTETTTETTVTATSDRKSTRLNSSH